MAANKLIETARSYIGVAEGSAAHKAIIDKYNTIKPLPRGYRATYMDAWCAVFVSFCALMSGVVLPYECGCQEMYKAFPDKRGRAATPGLGWVIFYDWQGDGHTEHVGIVESVKDGVITVIEGNHNDRVGRRQIRVGDPSIYGYGVPAFSEEKEVEKMDNAQRIWDFLLSWLGNAFGAAGLMGNIRAESALRPTNLQDRFEKSLGLTDEQYTARVDNGSYTNFVRDSAGYGLAQWTYWSRKQALLEFARARKASIGDLEMQLDFLRKEMESNYPTLVQKLKKAASVRAASNDVLFEYERPGDQSQKVQDLRASYGETYYKEYAGKERKVIVTRTKFLNGIIKTAEEAYKNKWVWGDSHTMPPSLDGKISCDRLVSRTLARDFGITNQKPGGWNSAELAVHLPEYGFKKTTNKADITPGTVVMIGKGPDQTYHTEVVERYDPRTGLCDKTDLGSTDRSRQGGRFKNVPLCEWPDRYPSVFFVPASDPAPTPKKTPKECIKEGQEALNKYFGAKLKVDGDHRKLTQTELIKAFQKALNHDYYGDGPMPVNGRLTELTRAGLGDHYVELDEEQQLVTFVEIAELLNGKDPGGVEYPEGHYGTNLEACTGKKHMAADDIWKLFRQELLKD